MKSGTVALWAEGACFGIILHGCGIELKAERDAHQGIERLLRIEVPVHTDVGLHIRIRSDKISQTSVERGLQSAPVFKVARAIRPCLGPKTKANTNKVD